MKQQKQTNHHPSHHIKSWHDSRFSLNREAQQVPLFSLWCGTNLASDNKQTEKVAKEKTTTQQTARHNNPTKEEQKKKKQETREKGRNKEEPNTFKN